MCHTTICCKCFQLGDTTRHHIFPRKWFKSGKNKAILFLCWECHKKLHDIIPNHIKFTKREYIEMHEAWLKGKPIMVKGVNNEKFQAVHSGNGRITYSSINCNP